jgi:putative oxidoreductase
MKRYVPNIAGVLMGLCFLAASIPVLFHMAPQPKIPEGTSLYHFMAAFGPTGYFTFVKVFELIGGILVMIPRLRNIGLLVLGPIIINIIATNVFIMGIPHEVNAVVVMTILIIVCALILLWNARAKFGGLLN